MSADWGGKALATTEILALKSTSNPPASATASPANASRPSTEGPRPFPTLALSRFLTAGCLTRTRISLERCAPSLIGLEAGAETRSFLSSATARIPSIAILRSRAGQRPKQVISEAQENLSQMRASSNQIRRVQGVPSGLGEAVMAQLQVPLRNRRRRRRALFRVRIAIRFYSSPEEDALMN